MDKLANKRTRLYSTRQLEAIIRDMTRQAAGLLTGRLNVAIVGIIRRGAPLADMLHAAMQREYGLEDAIRLDLQIKRYSDDLTLLYPETLLTEDPAHATLNLDGHTLLVVDDVIYRGHSMLRAVEYLARKQPAEIRTVVLVDRGAAKLPVRTDIVGVRLDVAPSDIIECNSRPMKKAFALTCCSQVEAKFNWLMTEQDVTARRKVVRQSRNGEQIKSLAAFRHGHRPHGPGLIRSRPQHQWMKIDNPMY